MTVNVGQVGPDSTAVIGTSTVIIPVSVYLSVGVCLSAFLSFFLSVCPSARPSTHPPIHTRNLLFICLSVCPFIHLPVYLTALYRTFLEQLAKKLSVMDPEGSSHYHKRPYPYHIHKQFIFTSSQPSSVLSRHLFPCLPNCLFI